MFLFIMGVVATLMVGGGAYLVYVMFNDGEM